MKRLQRCRRLRGGVILAMGCGLGALRGEVMTDGTTGAHTIQSLPAPYKITSDLGDKKGPNLFHSFSRFNIETGQSATFSGPADVRNILARVTGGSVSSIDGRLASTISGANLFLINPAGIIFGANASLDISGSFFATTADYLRLGTDGRFDASNPAATVLSIAPPSAFGFATPHPAAIHVNGSQLTGGGLKTLGLIAGDVTVQDGALLQAEDVQIFSVHAAGEAGLRLPDAVNGLGRPVIEAEGFSAHGAIAITGPALDAQLTVPPAVVRGQRIVIRGGTFVLKNATVQTLTAGPGDGVRIKVQDRLELTERSVIDSSNFGDMAGTAALDISAGSATVGRLSQISTQTGPDGAGGEALVSIRGALRLADEGGIVSESFSLIRGGDLQISADSIALENTGRILTHSNDTGKAGDIALTVAGRLSLVNHSTISIQPQPFDGGPTAVGGETLTATAGEIFVSGAASGFLFLDTSAQGTGGTIHLQSRGLLTIEKGGLVSAQTVGRDGAVIRIEAGDVAISGAGVSAVQPTGIAAQSAGGLGTRGGEIRLALSGSLRVLEGGVISTDAFGGGDGGSIDIRATDATVTGRGGALPELTENPRGITARNRSNSPVEASGPGGSVRLTLSGRLEVRDAGEILADTAGPGAGGSVAVSARAALIENLGTVAARTLALENGGPGGGVSVQIADTLTVGPRGLLSVSTSGPGAAGAIALRAGAVEVRGAGARIAAVSGAPGAPAGGRGGDIAVDADRLTLADGGQITASTYGPGAGGNLQIAAGRVRIEDRGGADFAGLSAQTLSPGAGGPGGFIQLRADTLEMRGAGAEISTQSLGGGAAGRIQIAADTVALRDGSTIESTSAGAGRAGSIGLTATGAITLRSSSSISVASQQADAGDIRLRSQAGIFLTGSSISARAALNGGSIDLRARDLLFLTDSRITAAAGLNGGNIFIDPVLVVLADSLISANAIRGRGGNVRIISDFFLAPPGSAVTATSQLGIDGTVQIDALNDGLTGSLVELPSELLNAESLLRELCSVKIENFSSFIREGRGGLPPLPGEALPSLLIVR